MEILIEAEKEIDDALEFVEFYSSLEKPTPEQDREMVRVQVLSELALQKIYNSCKFLG